MLYNYSRKDPMLKGLGFCAPFAPMVPTSLYYQIMVPGSRKVSYAGSLPIVNLRYATAESTMNSYKSIQYCVILSYSPRFQ